MAKIFKITRVASLSERLRDPFVHLRRRRDTGFLREWARRRPSGRFARIARQLPLFAMSARRYFN
jgi:hypothetical protein